MRGRDDWEGHEVDGIGRKRGGTLIKPCDENSVGEIITALWQRTNRIENFLGIEYDYDCVHEPNPYPGMLKMMQFLCERWSKISDSLTKGGERDLDG